jgi:hypothetical protein
MNFRQVRGVEHMHDARSRRFDSRERRWKRDAGIEVLR